MDLEVFSCSFCPSDLATRFEKNTMCETCSFSLASFPPLSTIRIQAKRRGCEANVNTDIIHVRNALRLPNFVLHTVRIQKQDSGKALASSPGHSQILSRSHGEKSGEGLGSKLRKTTSRTRNGGLS